MTGKTKAENGTTQERPEEWAGTESQRGRAATEETGIETAKNAKHAKSRQGN
jgi:hypothetical protein